MVKKPRRPLAFTLVVSALLASLAVAAAGYATLIAASRAEAATRAEALSASLRSTTQSFYESYWIAFEALAATREIREKDGPATDLLFRRLLAERPEFENVAAIGDDGLFFASSKPFDRRKPPSGAALAFYLRVAEGASRVVMEPHVGPISGQAVSGAVVRLRRDDGSFAGVLGASIRIEHLYEHWAPLAQGRGLGIAVASAGAPLFETGPLAAAAAETLAAGGGRATKGRAARRVDLAPFPGEALILVAPALDARRLLLSEPLPLAMGAALLAAIGGLLVLGLREDRRAAALARSLGEKQLLMAELHHRVKTSISLVHALLGLARDSERPAAATIESVRRKAWAIALVHRTLYETGELEYLPAGAFLRAVATGLREERGRGEIELELAVDEVVLHVDQALMVGIVAAELVDNVFAHAFPEGRAGAAGLDLERLADGSLRLSVVDDGIGPPEEGVAEGLGLFVCKLLCEQLAARFSLERRGGGGCAARVEFRPRGRA